MRSPTFLLAMAVVIFSSGAHAAPEILPLDVGKMREMQLEPIPPFPAEMVLKGKSENWEQVLYRGDFVLAVFEASPAVLEVSEPYPYDQFVLVLEGRVTLTDIGGQEQAYHPGDTFLVPKGWLGTWDMPVKYREMIVIETRAWDEIEE